MSNPLVHAERSAKRWGGQPSDYLCVHQWFDATKGHVPDNRHRTILHNSFGILLAEQVFGSAIATTSGRRVFVRDLGIQHVLEDLGFIPTLAECLAEMSPARWMAGGCRTSLSPALHLYCKGAADDDGSVCEAV